MYDGLERRKYRRIGEPFILDFQIKVKGLAEGDPAGWSLVGSQDLSAGGVRFLSLRKPDIGTFMDIRISYADFEEPLRCVGQVLRVENIEEGRVFSVATVFTEISDRDWGILIKLSKDLAL